MKKVIRVLAHDPGSTSYGFSVVEGYKVGTKLKLKILIAGHVQNTIKQMKVGLVHKKQIDAYVEELLEIKKKYKPQRFIAERYMNRGLKGTLIEVVSGMLHIAVRTLKLPYRFIAAVTWKRSITRCGVDLKIAYKWCKTTPHQLDATMMGVFALMKILKVPQHKIEMKPIILALEKVSKEKLTNRVLRRQKK